MKILLKLFYLVIIICALVLGIFFALQNTAPVPLDLLVVNFAEHSVALWVLAAFGVGGIVGMLTSLGLVIRLRAALLRANRQLRLAEISQ